MPTPAQRPAEFGGASAAVAVLIAHLLGLNDPSTIAALAVVVGFVPALITWLVSLFQHKGTSGPGAAA